MIQFAQTEKKHAFCWRESVIVTPPKEYGILNSRKSRQHSPEKSYTSQCETELWTSCHSWWQAPSPDCSAAGYVGFPLPADMTRREHQPQPSRIPWREEEMMKYKAWKTRGGQKRREELVKLVSPPLSVLLNAFIFQNVSVNLWCATYGISCGLFPSEPDRLTVSVSADGQVNSSNLQSNYLALRPPFNKMSAWCEWAENINYLFDSDEKKLHVDKIRKDCYSLMCTTCYISKPWHCFYSASAHWLLQSVNLRLHLSGFKTSQPTNTDTFAKRMC